MDMREKGRLKHAKAPRRSGSANSRVYTLALGALTVTADETRRVVTP